MALAFSKSLISAKELFKLGHAINRREFRSYILKCGFLLIFLIESNQGWNIFVHSLHELAQLCDILFEFIEDHFTVFFIKLEWEHFFSYFLDFAPYLVFWFQFFVILSLIPLGVDVLLQIDDWKHLLLQRSQARFDLFVLFGQPLHDFFWTLRHKRVEFSGCVSLGQLVQMAWSYFWSDLHSCSSLELLSSTAGRYFL